MDLQLVKKGLDCTPKRKKWVSLLAASGLSGYGAFRVYNLPSVVQKRRRLLKLLGALVSIAEVVASSAEAIGVITKDLNQFIQSDSDKIPNSFRQISKHTCSDEVSSSITEIARALTIGILRASRDGSTSNLTDQVLDKLFTTAGFDFASIVVGSFAKNLVMASYSNSNGRPMLNERWVDIVCDDRCRNLIGDCVQLFVSSAVAAYLDKTMDINTCEEICKGLTNPKHETKVREMLVSICNGAVETLVRTSHKVLTSTNSNFDSPGLVINLRDGLTKFTVPAGLTVKKWFDQNRHGGWVNKMYSTLAVPSNRGFVLDMTGRVTFEAVKSFIDILLEKISKCLKHNLNVVHEEIIDRGIEVFRCMTAKSSTVATICISLCLHILSSPWISAPSSSF